MLLGSASWLNKQGYNKIRFHKCRIRDQAQNFCHKNCSYRGLNEPKNTDLYSISAFTFWKEFLIAENGNRCKWRLLHFEIDSKL